MDGAFAISTGGFESRLRRLSGPPEGARWQYRHGRFRPAGLHCGGPRHAASCFKVRLKARAAFGDRSSSSFLTSVRMTAIGARRVSIARLQRSSWIGTLTPQGGSSKAFRPSRRADAASTLLRMASNGHPTHSSDDCSVLPWQVQPSSSLFTGRPRHRRRSQARRAWQSRQRRRACVANNPRAPRLTRRPFAHGPA